MMHSSRRVVTRLPVLYSRCISYHSLFQCQRVSISCWMRSDDDQLKKSRIHSFPRLSGTIVKRYAQTSNTNYSSYEEDVKKAKKPQEVDETKVDWRKVLPISFSGLLMGISGGAILPLMPMLFKELSLSSSEIGLIVGAAGFTRLLSNLPMGWAVEKYGRRPLLIVGPAFSALGLGLTGIATTGNHLVGCRSLTGIGSCSENTASQLYLSDISNAKNRARTMAAPVIAAAAGNIVGPALGTVSVNTLGMYYPFFIIGGLAGAVVLSNYILIPETKPPTPKDKEAAGMLRELKKAVKQWKPLLKLRDVRSVLYLQMSYWISAGSCIYTLLPLICTDQFAFTAAGISGLYISIAAISIIGTRLSASLSDNYGRKRALVPASLLLGASSIALPFATDPYTLCGIVGMWGVGSAMYGANSTAYISDITTENTKSQALVLLRSSGDLGMMMGATAAGIIAAAFGMHVPFIASGVFAAVAGMHMAFRANESNPPRNK